MLAPYPVVSPGLAARTLSARRKLASWLAGSRPPALLCPETLCVCVCVRAGVGNLRKALACTTAQQLRVEKFSRDGPGRRPGPLKIRTFAAAAALMKDKHSQRAGMHAPMSVRLEMCMCGGGGGWSGGRALGNLSKNVRRSPSLPPPVLCLYKYTYVQGVRVVGAQRKQLIAILRYSGSRAGQPTDRIDANKFPPSPYLPSPPPPTQMLTIHQEGNPR